MLLLCILHRGTCYLLVVFLCFLFGIWYLIIVCCWYLPIVCCCCVFWFGALGITLGGQIASCSAHQSTNTLLQMLGESGDLQDWNLWTKKAWTQNTLTLQCIVFSCFYLLSVLDTASWQKYSQNKCENKSWITSDFSRRPVQSQYNILSTLFMKKIISYLDHRTYYFLSLTVHCIRITKFDSTLVYYLI